MTFSLRWFLFYFIFLASDHGALRPQRQVIPFIRDGASGLLFSRLKSDTAEEKRANRVVFAGLKKEDGKTEKHNEGSP